MMQGIKRNSFLFLLGLILAHSIFGSISSGMEVSVRGQQNPAPGIFIQPNNQMAAWPEKQWQLEFQRMQDLGFKVLIVQWCRDKDIFYYPLPPDSDDNRPGQVAIPHRNMLGTIKRFAEQFGMEFYLGLYHEASFWEQIKQKPELLEGYLLSLGERNFEVAKALLPLVKDSPGFKGFYIPQEVDDLTWMDKDKARRLSLFLSRLTERLKRLQPDADVLISTFFRGRSSPGSFAEMWQMILSRTRIDVLLVQDGVGSGEVSLHFLERYLVELRKRLPEGKNRLWGVVEAFDVITDEKQEFVAGSAPMARVQQQMSTADPLVDKLVFFSLKYFIPSAEVPGSRELSTDYLKRREVR
ncbi:MAG: DUF4434 domain-containing protein [Proteobacteria bacterium]|nr:DUF4434 domain-containing protein [Pseudomonadota bacterium]MBU1708955.1 DUF4434 domain-containing protein [Pseudomonadota bacterium]